MQVGQKVVCINDTFPTWVADYYVSLPKKDKVYIIRGMCLGVDITNEPGEVVVYLVGVHNPLAPPPAMAERGFKQSRFRPLEELPSQQLARERELEVV